MSQQEFTETLPDIDVGDRPSAGFLTDRHHNAVEQLRNAFSKRRPLAILLGDGPAAASFVIRSFLSGLPDDVAVARITEPCSSATSLMQQLIAAVGFKPKDMNLDDLEGVFSMFLSFQKSHRRRTVICVERAQDNDLWVLDKLRELVETERDDEFGMLVVISGQSGLKDVLHSGPLSSVSLLGGKRIILTPFTLAETKEFLRQRLEATSDAGIDQLFQYKAITRLQALTHGVPDAVAALAGHCLALAEEEGVELVTAELVERAEERTQAEQEQAPLEDDPAAATVNMNGIKPPTGRLIFHLTGDEVRELALRQGHTLIGRSRLCDMRIASSIVSRQHALICHTPDGDILIDLGSMNGTFVDGYQVGRHELEAGETIVVGDCKIEYVLDHDSRSESGQSQTIASSRLSLN